MEKKTLFFGHASLAHRFKTHQTQMPKRRSRLHVDIGNVLILVVRRGKLQNLDMVSHLGILVTVYLLKHPSLLPLCHVLIGNGMCWILARSYK